jgi:flagellin
MIINHNIAAIFSHRTLKFHDWSMTKDIEKLSSGMRINKAVMMLLVLQFQRR